MALSAGVILLCALAQRQQYCIDHVVGCYNDNGDPRQLPHAVGLSKQLTHSECARACVSFCESKSPLLDMTPHSIVE